MTVSDPAIPLADTLADLRPALVARAAYLLGSRAAAEDVAQDTLVEIAALIETIDDPKRYALRAVHNRALNELRRRRRELDALQRSGEGISEGATHIDPIDSDLAAAFARLSPNQRACALLCWVDGLSAAEAAQIIGCSTPTVRVHLHRARRSLQTALPHRAPLEPR